MTCQGWQFLLRMLVVCGLLAGCRANGPINPPAEAPLEMAAVPRGGFGLVSLPPVDQPDSFVRPTSFVREIEEIPAPGRLGLAYEPTRDETSRSDLLELRDVIRSVQESYPLLVSALFERQVAEGQQIAASGEFDLRAKAFGIAAPEGFYKTYRNGISLDQPLFRGGTVFGGYKSGHGNFQPWFKERETDEGGEFSVGIDVPLLKDRSIDKRRAALFQSDLARRAVEPEVQALLFEFVRTASQIYWSWVAAGQTLEAQRELLRLAQERVRQIEERVIAGDLGKITRINNQQLIAVRETKVIESERKLEQAAFKLSLFFRDPEGNPVIPDRSLLPSAFPARAAPDGQQVETDIVTAIDAAPALQALDLLAQQVRVELDQAGNMGLPKLDARLLTSKDLGYPASSKRDKTPFELEAGLYGEVPLQRREARGKILATQGKFAQIEAKRSLIVDKITADVRDVYSALEANDGRIDRATINLRLARETLELGRLQFEAGDIDLIALNIYEQAVTDAQLLLISAQADFLSSLADYRAVLALDPTMFE